LTGGGGSWSGRVSALWGASCPRQGIPTQRYCESVDQPFFGLNEADIGLLEGQVT